MYIYNNDGTKKWIENESVDEINISPTDILKIENHKNGVNLHLKNGQVKFLDGCKTKDGFVVEWIN